MWPTQNWMLHDTSTLNSPVSPNKADVINDDKSHDRDYDHPKAGKFIESDICIEPAKLEMAEITTEKKDNDTSRNQKQWNTVEVWETEANSNNEKPE